MHLQYQPQIYIGNRSTVQKNDQLPEEMVTMCAITPRSLSPPCHLTPPTATQTPCRQLTVCITAISNGFKCMEAVASWLVKDRMYDTPSLTGCILIIQITIVICMVPKKKKKNNSNMSRFRKMLHDVGVVGITIQINTDAQL